MKKMKSNNKGFILAETLVVTVFLMILFTMLYSNFYPLIGEYEKRENYDTVDGKYSVFWLKRMIEDSSYSFLGDSNSILNFDSRSYVRFQCSDISEEDEKRTTCINMVKSLQIQGCDKNGDNCEIYITKYRLGDPNETSTNFKTTVSENLKKYEENCFTNQCRQIYITTCMSETGYTEEDCAQEADKKVFRGSFQDYVEALPDYTVDSLNGANYRVIAEIHNTKDNNNYYSYSTMEVKRNPSQNNGLSPNMHAVNIKYNANGGKLKEDHGASFSLSGNIILKDGASIMHVLLSGHPLPDGGLMNYNDPSNINLERLGYEIESGKEWNTKSNRTGTDYNQTDIYTAENFCPTISTGSCNITLYANWKPKTYSITYDYNGGASVENPVSYTVETDTFTLNNPSDPDFAGWTGSNGTEIQKTVQIPKGSTEDRHYKANWLSKGPYSNNESPAEMYQTLEEALNGTETGHTITLNFDYTDNSAPNSSKDVTINLNGHTLITKKKMTISGGTTNIINGTLQNADSERTIELSGGTLVVDGTSNRINILNKRSLTTERETSCTIYNSSHSTVIIKGDQALVKSGMGGNSRFAKTIHNDGTLTIEGGVVEANATNGFGATAINTAGTFTMTGGYIYATKLSKNRCGVCVTGGTTRITGGKIEVVERTAATGLDGGAINRVSSGCTYVGKNVTLKCKGTNRCLFGGTPYLYKQSGGPIIEANDVETPDTGTKVGTC